METDAGDWVPAGRKPARASTSPNWPGAESLPYCAASTVIVPLPVAVICPVIWSCRANKRMMPRIKRVADSTCFPTCGDLSRCCMAPGVDLAAPSQCRMVQISKRIELNTGPGVALDESDGSTRPCPWSPVDMGDRPVERSHSKLARPSIFWSKQGGQQAGSRSPSSCCLDTLRSRCQRTSKRGCIMQLKSASTSCRWVSQTYRIRGQRKR